MKGVDPETGHRFDDTRRSVYTPIFRNKLLELFEVFDFADPSVPTGTRNTSTAVPQALFLMNHPFVMDQARHAAARLSAEGGADEEARVMRAYRLALGREARPHEETALAEYGKRHGMANACRVLLNCNEFVFVR